MIGRAGRAGFDEKGEAVTIVRAGPEERMVRYVVQAHHAIGGEGYGRRRRRSGDDCEGRTEGENGEIR